MIRKMRPRISTTSVVAQARTAGRWGPGIVPRSAGDAGMSRMWRLVIEHGENGERIDASTSQPYAPVEVRSRHPARRADLSDLLSAHDGVSFMNADDGEVREERKESESVIQNDGVSRKVQ